MSDNSTSSRIGNTAKYAIAGLSTAAVFLFGYVIYSKYFAKKRSSSSSSESGDDTALI